MFHDTDTCGCAACVRDRARPHRRHITRVGDPTYDRELCASLMAALDADGCSNTNCCNGWHDRAWRALRVAANFPGYGRRVPRVDLVDTLRKLRLLDP